MASNFRVSTHRNSENVHLQLIGDFDGVSACRVLDILKNDCKSVNKVFIHTNSLRRIHPLGCNKFHNHLNSLNREPIQIVFTGENARKIDP